MSVLLETSAGDIVIDLLVEHAPKLCEKYAFSIPLTSRCTMLTVSQLLKAMQDKVL